MFVCFVSFFHHSFSRCVYRVLLHSLGMAHFGSGPELGHFRDPRPGRNQFLERGYAFRGVVGGLDGFIIVFREFSKKRITYGTRSRTAAQGRRNQRTGRFHCDNPSRRWSFMASCSSMIFSTSSRMLCRYLANDSSVMQSKVESAG